MLFLGQIYTFSVDHYHKIQQFVDRGLLQGFTITIMVNYYTTSNPETIKFT